MISSFTARRALVVLFGLALVGAGRIATLGGAQQPAPAMPDAAGPAAKTSPMRVYIGTYAKAGSPGIFVYDLDPATGALEPAGAYDGGDNPSFLALAPDGATLYAINEVMTYDGQPTGYASAFDVDPATGALTLMNRQSTGGTGPCHISLQTTRDSGIVSALVSNYGGGSAARLAVGSDASLAPPTGFAQHTGSGGDPKRQKQPRAHCAIVDPAGDLALVADLGIDKVMLYRLDVEQIGLEPADPPALAMPPASGPRDLAFHPSGRYLYVFGELNSSITTFVCNVDDAGAVTFAPLETVSALPPDFEGTHYGAHVEVHPSGRFLYASNRGPNTIAAFAVDEAFGNLTQIGQTSTRGDWPRHFAVDPTGAVLIAANQKSGDLAVYALDPESGALAPLGLPLAVPAPPVCVVFAPRPHQ